MESEKAYTRMKNIDIKYCLPIIYNNCPEIHYKYKPLSLG